MRVCAVIPAAGKAERLGGVCKTLIPMSDNGPRVIDHVLSAIPVADRVVVVQHYHAPAFYDWNLTARRKAEIKIQLVSYGTADAIFSVHSYWKDFDKILVVWGDQVFASQDTITSALNHSYWAKPNTIVCPTIKKEKPYVDYVMLPNRPLKILKKRNLDTTRVLGVSDVGVFVIPTKDIEQHWNDFCHQADYLRKTNKELELDLLDFIQFLVNDRGWIFDGSVKAKSVFETYGINTWDEVTFARRNLHRGI